MTRGTTPQQPLPWEIWFSRSSHGPDIWHTSPFNPPPGVPLETTLSTLWKSYTVSATWEFADGYLVIAERRNANWVRGWAAMRYLCLTAGIEWPKKHLPGEPFVPDPELLMVAVAEWARIGPVYGYSNPYSKPVAIRPDHREGFWALLEEIHIAEGVNTGAVELSR